MLVKPRFYRKQLTMETVVSLSEQMWLNVFVRIEETKRERQRNWQATRNMHSFQLQHSVNHSVSFSVFSTCLSIPPNHIVFTFSHSFEEFLMVSMKVCSFLHST